MQSITECLLSAFKTSSALIFSTPLCLREGWFLTTGAIEYEALPHECRERAHVIVQIPSRANS